MRIALLLAFSLAMAQPSWAATKPTDVITILKLEGEYGDKESVYTKPYSALVLSNQERTKIAAINAQLDKEVHDFPNYLYRLTHIRVAGDEVQRLLFQNKHGDTVIVSFDSGEKCFLWMGGNGAKGQCDKPFG